MRDAMGFMVQSCRLHVAGWGDGGAAGLEARLYGRQDACRHGRGAEGEGPALGAQFNEARLSLI